MPRLSWFQQLYWRHFAKPAENRKLFQRLLAGPIDSVLEIGVGNGQRMKQILTLHSPRSGTKQLRYAAVDLFESGPRSAGHLKLKDVHKLLAERSAKAVLIPGDATNALARLVQTVMPSDLVIIDEGWGDGSAVDAGLRQWMPRLVHESSTVFARSSANSPLQEISIAPIQVVISRAA
jgi:hypothetical protein